MLINRPHRLVWGLVGLLALAVATVARAQDVTFTPMLLERHCTSAVVADGWVYTGLWSGGLAAWNAADPSQQRLFTAREGLGGSQVSALAWTGRNLWVATRDGGLARMTDPGSGAPVFRLYTFHLDVTTVTGTADGQTERVYYGTGSDGFGIINDGLFGGVYSTGEGLISNTVLSLAVAGDVLYIATPAGVDRFVDNVFTTLAAGLEATVTKLAADAQGRVVATTEDGVYRWSETAGQWELLGGAGNAYTDIVVAGGTVYVLREDDQVSRLQNDVLVTVGVPADDGDNAVAAYAIAVAGTDLWVAGGRRAPEMQDSHTRAGYAWLARRKANGDWNQWWRDGSIVGNGDGVAFDVLGRAVVGEREGDGLSLLAPDGTWSRLTTVASAANGWAGLFNIDGGVLSIVTDATGAIWFCQYYSGIIRWRPSAITGADQDAFDLIHPGNSALLSPPTVIRLGTHPQGPIFIMTDVNVADAGVQVLVDPGDWQNASQWVTPDVGGNTVWASLVERPDVIWFAVADIGLVRWDVNGLSAGPEAPLTWTDLGDDYFSDPLTAVSANSQVELGGTEALLRDAAGNLWAAANGVVEFQYSVASGVTAIREIRQKSTSLGEGLLSNAVNGLAFDRNGDLWVVTDIGLNRIRLGEDPVRIDAYTDLANYLALAESGLYSSNIVAPLPGGTYRQLAADATGEHLVVSSDRGAAKLTIAAAAAGAADPLAGVYLYPNPFPGDGDGSLRLGGIAADDAGGDPALVEIFNLQGQLVYRNLHVSANTPFWTGINRTGDGVASGLYTARIRFQGAAGSRVIAVVR